ncbi:mandelate racemase/muconate lactonizing enzyme family protein [Qiania dongpingensis]|uniref:Mandelate racemase/muconate lactonizing enzyme C-terminal domain-containing protein n=1 Tax=Qiania dongpingensis TaxID=2763669 RepID=A0A7G9G5C2_9FIRM|nr:enolase C-terminal domain-like protein [Qiania dongpingensis]QNM06004.1 hypothetical protein H9Q78_02220 [Qiania dongpingensis]
MKIKNVSVYTCLQPLKIPFSHASSGLVTNLEGVYVKLEAEDGTAGFGEVRGNCSYFTGDTTGAVVSTICSAIAPKMVGQDAENLNVLHQIIEESLVGNTAAKAACDCAAYDLAGKLAGKPVYELLGGKLNDRLPSEENIPFMTVEEAEKRAEEIIDSGCRFIKVRVGGQQFRYDEERVSAVWDVIRSRGVQDEVVYSVDANQAWNTREAIRNLNRLAEYGVTIAEQPVHYNSPIRLKELKENCPMKLFGDECVATVEDLARYIEMGAVDGIHIKLIKCGGIYNAVRLMNLAKAHEIEYMIGGMDEGMMAVAAAVQCGAVAETKLFEVHGHVRIKADATSGLVVHGSVVEVPDGPGLGVTVREEMLKKVFSAI